MIVCVYFVGGFLGRVEYGSTYLESHIWGVKAEESLHSDQLHRQFEASVGSIEPCLNIPTPHPPPPKKNRKNQSITRGWCIGNLAGALSLT